MDTPKSQNWWDSEWFKIWLQLAYHQYEKEKQNAR